MGTGKRQSQTAASNALKNRWLGCVAARVVAGCLGLRSSDAIAAVASDETAKFHTSGHSCGRLPWPESCRGKACGRVWGPANAVSNALKNRWLGCVAARLVAGCLGLRVAVERLGGAFGARQTAVSKAFKNRWLGCVAVRICKSCRGKAWGAFGAWQTAASNALKNRWLGCVAARLVAGCLGLSWLESCRGKAWGSIWGPANGSLKRQPRTPLKTDGWGVWLPELWPVALACGVRMPLLLWQATKQPSSTPPVVPGAAPASAKAGVGGFQGRLIKVGWGHQQSQRFSHLGYFCKILVEPTSAYSPTASFASLWFEANRFHLPAGVCIE